MPNPITFNPGPDGPCFPRDAEELYEVKVTVTLQMAVNTDQFHERHGRGVDTTDLMDAGIQAVTNALSLAEANGFSHRYADCTSTSVMAVDQDNVELL